MMPADKYLSIFSRQMEVIVYLHHALQIWQVGAFLFYSSFLYFGGVFNKKKIFHLRLLDMKWL